jgi:ferric-dicitrate binding protein FerR (iron transport regulator)
VTRRLESPEQARERLEAEALVDAERAQLWQRIAASTAPAALRSRRNTRALWIAGPALAAAAAAALLVVDDERRDELARAAGANAVDPASACTLDAAARELALPARCGEREVRIAEDDWLLAAGSQVARTDDGAHVRAGRVRFAVRKRKAGTQFRVRVSHGEVRVIGTVFVVEQHGATGSVTVSAGVIEFVWADGQRERVTAGQSLRWPREPRRVETAAEPGAVAAVDAGARVRDAGSAPGSARASPDLDRMLERLLQLQSQQRHGEAVALLRKTLSEPRLAAVQRERISYELGLALEAAGKPSCAHWQQHVARFGGTRHGAVLAERIVGCRTRR